MKKSLLTFFLSTIFVITNTKLHSQKLIEKDLSFEKIEKKLDNLQHDKVQALALIDYYIKKSKREKNSESLLYAYRYASKYNPVPKSFKYADSALTIAIDSKNTKVITDAYLNKGTIFMDEGRYKRALDNILIAHKYAVQLKDDYLINKTIYFIAQNKIYLGNYEDANRELKTCVAYFKAHADDLALGKNSQMYYLYSLMCYLDTNTKTGNQQENKALIANIIPYLHKNNLKEYLPYFISIEGSDAYYNKDYPTSISKSSQALELYNDQWTHITELFYIGLSNWKLGNRDLAVKYLEKIDQEYEKENKLEPEFRPAYEYLIKYNDSIGDKDKQLHYIKKLMQLDQSYLKNFTYINSRINKEYDTHQLLTEKSEIERYLRRSRIIAVSLLISILVISFFGYRSWHLQKKYKAKFEMIFSGTLDTDAETRQEIVDQFGFRDEEKEAEAAYYNKIPGLKPHLVKKTLDQLEKFEKEHGYTDPQISIKLLSENFETNYVYLSKVINEYRGQSFSLYINDLRLEYAMKHLKEKKYLDLDIKELAHLSGFTTATCFSVNFVRKYQMKPSCFIKMLKKNT